MLSARHGPLRDGVAVIRNLFYKLLQAKLIGLQGCFGEPLLHSHKKQNTRCAGGIAYDGFLTYPVRSNTQKIMCRLKSALQKKAAVTNGSFLN